MEQRESFVFYRSFFEALQGCPDDIRLAVYEEVMQYALYPDYEPRLQGVGKSLFMLIKPQLDANLRRRENGKKGAEYGQKGGRPKKENPTETPKKPLNNPTETPNVNVNVNDNVNVNVNDNVNESIEVSEKPKRTRAKFEKPTLEQCQEYADTMLYTFDVKHFYDFYESNGWRVGRNPMKDWRAAIRNWNKNEQNYNNRNGNGNGNHNNDHPTNAEVIRNTYEIIEELRTLDEQGVPTFRDF